MELHEQPWVSLVNSSTLNWCSPLILNSSCVLQQDEKGKIDALAGLRMVVSCLSILGAVSIVFSAVWRRQVLSPKVHPIFVLSIADFMLAVLWLAGSAVWLGKTSGMRRGWCLMASLITIITECVAINLTLVYAMLAYSSVKKKDRQENQVYQQQNVMSQVNERSEDNRVWHPCKSVIIYCIAWLLPLFLIMVPFSVIVTTGQYHMLDHIVNCTCWCKPSFGNIIPHPGRRTDDTHQEIFLYNHELRKVLLVYGVVLSTHYLVVFVLLVICYFKILKRVKQIAQKHNHMNAARHYGAVPTRQMTHRQSQAKKRVVYFLLVFIITGFFNLILSLSFTVGEAKRLYEESILNRDRESLSERPAWLGTLMLVILFCQSLTVPLQGFLNALVYGWTREDFLNAVTTKSNLEEPNEQDLLDSHDNHMQREISTANSRSNTLSNGVSYKSSYRRRRSNLTEQQELFNHDTDFSDVEALESSTELTYSIHKV